MSEREKGIVEKSAYVARNAGITIGVVTAFFGGWGVAALAAIEAIAAQGLIQARNAA